MRVLKTSTVLLATVLILAGCERSGDPVGVAEDLRPVLSQAGE